MTWKNFPIPETIVFPLLIGLILEAFFSLPIFAYHWVWIGISALLFLLGLFLMIWAVREAGFTKMELPDRLVTSGPYAFSRNPMYLGWIMVYLAVFLFSHSLWLAILFVIALILTHYIAILPEERDLKERFGGEYKAYSEKVRRYL